VFSLLHIQSRVVALVCESGDIRQRSLGTNLCEKQELGPTFAKQRSQGKVSVCGTKEEKKIQEQSPTKPTTNQPTNHTYPHKMAKDRSEKKEKKEKRKSVDASGVKKEKKEKRKSDATAVLNAIEDAAPGAVAVDADGDVIVDASVVADESSDAAIPIGALVPFANPLCDDKATKKVLKTVKKGEFLASLTFNA
jgi:hypothetical protein